MPRPPNPNPPQNVHVMIPKELYNRICLLLVSPAEGRVPHGGMSAFFTQAAEHHLQRLLTLAKETPNASES